MHFECLCTINCCLSCEAHSHSAVCNVLRLLWNAQVHYRVHRIPTLIAIVSQMTPIHALTPYLFKSFYYYYYYYYYPPIYA
jgi:hypothetical protein